MKLVWLTTLTTKVEPLKPFSLFLILIMGTLSTLLTSCDSASFGQEETKFISQLKEPKVQDINRSITLILDPDPGNPSAFMPLGGIHLVVRNQSRKSIKFPRNLNAQLFLFSEETKHWESIKDAVSYTGMKEIVTAPRGKGLDIIPLSVVPDFESNGQEQRLRAAVTGYIIDEEKKTNEPVSAFIEFKVKPFP